MTSCNNMVAVREAKQTIDNEVLAQWKAITTHASEAVFKVKQLHETGHQNLFQLLQGFDQWNIQLPFLFQ